MFRIEDNVPHYYVDHSRDFQLFCRLYDIAFTSVKRDIDNVINFSDCYKCPDRLLDLLAVRVGFFDYKSLPTDALRMILAAFPYIMKHKGTITAIKECINLFLRYNKSQNVEYEIDSSGGNVTLTLETTFGNEYILDILLAYVIPTGCRITYQISNIYNFEEQLEPDELSLVVRTSSANNSKVSSSTITQFLTGSCIFELLDENTADTEYTHRVVLGEDCFIDCTEVEKSGSKLFIKTPATLNYQNCLYTLSQSQKNNSSYVAWNDLGVRAIEITFMYQDASTCTYQLRDQILSEDELMDSLSLGMVGTTNVYVPLSSDESKLVMSLNNTINSVYQQVQVSREDNIAKVKVFTAKHSNYQEEYTNGQFIAIKNIDMRNDTTSIPYSIDRSQNTFIFNNLETDSTYKLYITYYDGKVISHDITN